jgi:hypothetical protein
MSLVVSGLSTEYCDAAGEMGLTHRFLNAVAAVPLGLCTVEPVVTLTVPQPV